MKLIEVNENKKDFKKNVKFAAQGIKERCDFKSCGYVGLF